MRDGLQRSRARAQLPVIDGLLLEEGQSPGVAAPALRDGASGSGEDARVIVIASFGFRGCEHYHEVKRLVVPAPGSG